MDLKDMEGLIYSEVVKAEGKFPHWHKDIIHAAAVLCEESGELLQACINYHFGRGTIDEVEKEMAHTGAMVYRFGLHLENYKPREKK